MKTLKLFLLAGAAIAVSTPVLAGRDQAQLMQQERAIQQLRSAQGLAGPVGARGAMGPGTPAERNLGHPTERVRR